MSSNIEDEIKGTINQLEGRFSFINQLEWYNNKLNLEGKKLTYEYLNGRERAYSQFIFYKYFFANPKPLIVTEGKTDVAYLKAALKNLWKEYPNLVSRNSKGQFEYKVSFLQRSKRLAYFLNFKKDGADTMNNIYKFFSEEGGEKYPNYIEIFKNLGSTVPLNSVILLFDNELNNKNKPVYKFVSNKISDDRKKQLCTRTWINLLENLYLIITPLVGESEECDIEMLFDEATLSHEIGGKKFCKKDTFDTSKFYGKEIFSQYIMKNYSSIDFGGFKPLLNNINMVIKDYKERIQ